MKKALIAVLAGMALFSCKMETEKGPSPEEVALQKEAESAEALAAIEKANAEVPRLILAGEYEAAGAYFAEDLVQMITGQPPIYGREAWIAAQQQAAAIGEWSLELEVVDFEYLGDRAVERGRGIQTFTANQQSPMPSMKMTGDYMVMWTRTDSGWQIQWDYVVIQPPAGPPGGAQ